MTSATPAAGALECVREPARAAVLLQPLRLEVLRAAAEPISASRIAERLGLPRQRVGYHVRALAAAGFLRRAGTRKRRNMTEQRFVATARAYALSPELLGPLAALPARIADEGSAAYLLACAGQLELELARARAEAEAARRRLATLAISSELRFESAARRSAFARALEEAVLELVREYAAPGDTGAAGGRARARPYRLLVGCWPVPPPLEGATSPTQEGAR